MQLEILCKMTGSRCVPHCDTWEEGRWHPQGADTRSMRNQCRCTAPLIARCSVSLTWYAIRIIGLISFSTAGLAFGTSRERTLEVHAKSPVSTTPAADARVLADDAGLGESRDGWLLLKYAVECALSPSDRLTTLRKGKKVVLNGSLGLTPSWKERPLSPTGQRWLSACILARINAFGVTVKLSLRGDHAALLDNLRPEEMRDYGFVEGAFYGNFFSDPPETFVCSAESAESVRKLPPTRRQRVCTEPSLDDPTISRCGMVITGKCSEVCRTHDLEKGYFSQCTGNGKNYTEVATVLLKNR